MITTEVCQTNYISPVPTYGAPQPDCRPVSLCQIIASHELFVVVVVATDKTSFHIFCRRFSSWIISHLIFLNLVLYLKINLTIFPPASCLLSNLFISSPPRLTGKCAVRWPLRCATMFPSSSAPMSRTRFLNIILLTS